MRWSAWPRPNAPRSTSTTWQRRSKKGLGNEIALDLRRLIQVDLPEAADAGFVDRAEVMLAMGIVVVGEGVEGANLREQRATLIDRHGFDAGGDHHGAADEGAAEGVVEGADAFGGGHGGAGHGFGLLRLRGWDGRAWSGHARNRKGRPAGRPIEFGGRLSARHLPETRNSGCGTAMSWGRLLNAGYSGASNHSRVNSPGSIRLTVATQKPSNSRFWFQ